MYSWQSWWTELKPSRSHSQLKNKKNPVIKFAHGQVTITFIGLADFPWRWHMACPACMLADIHRPAQGVQKLQKLGLHRVVRRLPRKKNKQQQKNEARPIALCLQQTMMQTLTLLLIAVFLKHSISSSWGQVGHLFLTKNSLEKIHENIVWTSITYILICHFSHYILLSRIRMWVVL